MYILVAISHTIVVKFTSKPKHNNRMCQRQLSRSSHTLLREADETEKRWSQGQEQHGSRRRQYKTYNADKDRHEAVRSSHVD
jgi:hypothetical protein